MSAGRAKRAMSPVAKMPGALVSRKLFTLTPRSSARPTLSRQLRTRPHPAADNDHIGLQYASALETDLVAFDPSRGFAEMEDAYGTSAQRKGVQRNRSRTMHFFCH